MSALFWRALQATDNFEFYATEHFRISGVYWGVTALALLGHLDDMDGDAVVKWVLSCQNSDGGFGGSPRHNSHLLYTLSAVQILALYAKLDLIDPAKISSCEWALSILQVLGRCLCGSQGYAAAAVSALGPACCFLPFTL